MGNGSGCCIGKLADMVREEEREWDGDGCVGDRGGWWEFCNIKVADEWRIASAGGYMPLRWCKNMWEDGTIQYHTLMTRLITNHKP